MEENKENVVEEVVNETTQETQEQEVQEQEQPKEEVQKPDYSKFQTQDNPEVIKIDLSKPPPNQENAESTDTNEESDVQEEVAKEETVEEVTSEQTTEESVEKPTVEEVTNETTVESQDTEKLMDQAVEQSENTGEPLPEDVQGLLDFMRDTGGDLNDYIQLKEDFNQYDDKELLREYWYRTKPHLSGEEVDFMMQDEFSYDEDTDEEKDIKRKKLALKEQVAGARTHLEELKSRYYREIKAGSKLTQEQQKAVDFFNRYNKNAEQTQKQSETLRQNFTSKTNEVFNDNFKGFEYNIGDKKFRYNVKNANDIKTTQTDINNFARKFLDEKTGALKDGVGYHKSLFTAMNADAIANHFYEQGRADALKSSVAKSKNIDMNPRQQHGNPQTGGPKFRVLRDNTASFKFPIKNK